MIFKTFDNDLNRIINKVGIFNKSLRNIGKDYKSGNGLFTSLFSGNNVTQKDIQAITAMEQEMKNGSTMAKAWMNNMRGCTLAAKEQAKQCLMAKGSLSELTANMNNATLSAKAGKIALQGLAIAGNMLAFMAITKLITSMYELTQVSKNVAQKAKDVSSEFSSSSSSINDYKSKIDDLYKTINDSGSSVEDVTNARKNLMAVQDELISKFGDEREAVNLITDAINGQVNALDNLTQAQWQEAQNEFNDSGLINKIGNFFGGYSDNIERMVDEYGNYTAKINIGLFDGLSDENAEQYKEFRKLLEEKFGAVTSEEEPNFLRISGNATEVYQKLLDIQNLASNLDFSDSSANHLTSLANSAKEVSDQYKDMWDQYILYEKVLKDSDAAQTYKNILDAAEAYKKAFASGDEEAINAAVESFSNIMEEATANLDDDSIIEFFNNMYPDIQAITDKWEFKTKVIPEIDTSELQGKTANDIFKMFTTDGVQKGESAFNSILEKAIEYGFVIDDSTEEVQKLIDLLVEWKILQGDISSEASNLEEPKWDYSTTLENLDKVSEKLEVLDKSFAKLFDKDEYIGWEDLASISEAFKDMEGIEDYVKRIQEAGQDTEKVSEVFGELTGKYLEHAGVLSNVTEENATLIASMLTEMGIANAEEIVYAQLNETAETLALKKRFLAETGYELVDATLAEVAQFLNEVNASNEAKQALAQLALEKVNLSNINFDESSNIDQLISLANAAGASAMAIAKAKQAIATINSINEKGANGSAGDFKRLDYASKTLNDIKNHIYDWQYEKLNANDFKINSSPKSTPKYKGGTNTNKAIDQAKKDAEKESKKAAKESEDTFKESIDFFKQRVEVLTEAFENLEKGMENVFGSGAKNTLLSAQIGILDEEVNNYTDALAMYRKKASDALSGIDSDLRDKIVNGAVQITDFIGKGNEDVVEAIEDYQGWADEVSNCTQKLEELKTQIRQLELQKFNNIADDFADQFDLRDSGKDLLKKEIDLIEESNRLVSDSLYKAQIDQTQKQLGILNKEKEALADQMASALKSGNIDTGTDEWLEMVDKLSEVEGSILDCETAIEEFNNAIKQLEIDKFDRIADHFTNLYDGLEEANTMAKKQIDLIKESGLVVNDSLYQSQISQSKKQLELLKQEEQSLKDQLSKALDSGYIESGSDEWLEMMKSIQGVEESILDCETAIEEFNNEIKQLEVDKFNRIADHYNDLRDSLNSSNDLISKQIGLLEEAGELVGASYYTTQIDQLKKQLDLLDQERKSLSDQLNTSVSSGIIKEGSDEWLEMMKTIQEVDGSILDCQTSIEEFDNAILNIHTNVFDRIQNQFSDLDSELSNLRGLFDDLEVSDDKGVWTKEGLAQLGLLAQQYELAEYRVKQYNDEIDDLTAQYLAGRYSVTEYTDRLSELTSAQWDAVNASENVKDAIIELNEVRINKEIEGIEKEIDAFKELTDAQIKALDSTKALKEYQDSIAEKSKAVADIERQLAAMQYDNSAATIAKRKQLEEQLAEAKKTLADAEYDHSIEAQKDALNQQYEAFETERNAEIEALRLSLEQREVLIAESFANVKANTETIATEISEIANNHGITVSNTLIDAWKSGENAITSYGETLQTESDLFIQQLLNVENGVYELQEQADQSSQALSDMFATQADNLINELNRSYDSENQLIQESYYLQDVLADMFATQADGLINELQSAYASENQLIMESYNLQDVLARMFGTRADNLVNELMSSYYSEANLNAMTNTLQNSLINTLERGYNINGITSALSSIAEGANSVADAANKAAQALANMGAAQTNYGSASDSDTKHGFKVYDSHTGKLKDIIYSDDWDVNDLRKKYDGSARGIRVQKFAKGGIVSKEDDGIFDPIAKSLGEDTMVAVKYGEGIISAEEMKKMSKLSEALAKIDSDLLSPSYIRPGIQPTIPEYVRTERPNITLHYDRMFEFNGDFNNSEQLLRQMERVATNSTTKILDEINRDFRIHGK